MLMPGTPVMIAAMVSLTLPTAAAAQDGEPDSAMVQAVTRTLRSDLRNFVTAQERYFVDHMRYAPSMRRMAPLYRPSASVTVVLLTSSGTGHSEIAIDARVPGLVCAMFVGDAPAPLGRGAEGEVICRGP